jgi:hypothetical protein
MQTTQFITAGFGPNRRIFRRRERSRRRRIVTAVLTGVGLVVWAALFGSTYTAF